MLILYTIYFQKATAPKLKKVHCGLNNLSFLYIINEIHFGKQGKRRVTKYVYTEIFTIVSYFNGISATYISDNLYL